MTDKDAERQFLERRDIYLSLRGAEETLILQKQFENDRKRGVVPIYVAAAMMTDDPRRQELEAAEKEAREEKARREQLRLRNRQRLEALDW